MPLSLLFLIMLLMPLTGCGDSKAIESIELYKCREWPDAPEKPRSQSDVAEYITKGFTAWKSCSATIDIVSPDK